MLRQELAERTAALDRHNQRVRKSQGAYYTPPALVEHVVRHALGPLLAKRSPRQAAGLRILDPACGSGVFLLGAYEYLLGCHRDRSVDGKLRILRNNLRGVEIDPQAADVARLSLLAKVLEAQPGGDKPRRSFRSDVQQLLGETIKTGNALLDPDLEAFQFDAVLGNPPWGQKAVSANAALKRRLWQRFPSSAGIFDLFRPFVELGVRLTAIGGRFGMVLPDIVLLKDYPQTRRHLLDHLTLERIDWWGRAFDGAVIDTVTIIGSKRLAGPAHRVAVAVHDPDAPLAHDIPQAEFRANRGHVFNLHLTAERRRLLARLEDRPRLGDYFEIHEGVHSGNLRAELFVDHAVDATCRELLFGRDEIAPYRLTWQGRHIRLGALPKKKTRARYANLGRPEWHEQEKVLVRRTGDFILAAVDRAGRYASNNFFLVFPCRECALDLDGLCALLNSRFMTWYFRTIEPRRGRVFAELKIKHLRTFPLPRQALTADGCDELNELGRQRGRRPQLDARIDALVNELFGLPELE
jgi:SAM-dependent methyltransferase